MLINYNKLSSSQISATDGDLGKIKDVYFDDQHWAVRFLVVDTHKWLPLSQKVLLSPIAVLKVNEEDAEVKVSMSKELVKDCPKVEEQETVSREFETIYFDYFGYGYYWTGADAWGAYANPTALVERDMILANDITSKEAEQEAPSENHLRSAHEILDYDVVATDGNKGHVSDFVWDTDDWRLKFVVIDTKTWLNGGKKVLVSRDHIDSINWADRTVICTLTIQQIIDLPEYKS
jgi:sporulation protein YlmC with PRC-barrel domain